jgi:hypothetical protein
MDSLRFGSGSGGVPDQTGFAILKSASQVVGKLASRGSHVNEERRVAGAAGLEPGGQNLRNNLKHCALGGWWEESKSPNSRICAHLNRKLV